MRVRSRSEIFRGSLRIIRLVRSMRRSKGFTIRGRDLRHSGRQWKGTHAAALPRYRRRSILFLTVKTWQMCSENSKGMGRSLFG